MNQRLKELSDQLEGELYVDDTTKILYATDASAYREMPLAVAIPKSITDLKKLIAFCHGKSYFINSKNCGYLTCRARWLEKALS